jgi:23S rRNA (adenine1618-N6)-methyltransferase
MHRNNIFNQGYDFLLLADEHPSLKPLLFKNEYDRWTIDFGIKKNVRLFNQALVKKYFDIDHWEIPEENLCPTIPGRADYLYHLKDFLGEGPKKLFDIGTGASVVYPLVGNRLFNWTFVGSEISTKSLANAQKILEANEITINEIEIRQQKVKRNFFKNIIQENETFDASICNPPFFESEEQATSWNWKKWKSDKAKSVGTLSELVVKGGEKLFISNMIRESVNYKNQIKFFTTLVSKSSTVPLIKKECEQVEVSSLEFIELKTGKKVSRIAVWRF